MEERTILSQPPPYRRGILPLIVAGWIFLILAFSFIIHSGITATRTLWPGLHDDGALFSTVIINRANGLGNTFDVYTPVLLRKIGDDKSLTSHGQLYYAVLAPLLPEGSYASLLRLLHQLNLVGFGVAFAVFLLLGRRNLNLPWLASGLLGLIGASATGAILTYLQGRPEHGVLLLLLAYQLPLACSPRPFAPFWWTGLAVGLSASMSPLPGCVFAAGTAVSIALNHHCTRPAIHLIATAMVAVSAWAVSNLLVFEGSLIDLIRATIAEFPAKDWTGNPLPEMVEYWLKLRLAPGVGVITGVTVAAAATLTISRLRQDRTVSLRNLVLVAGLLPQTLNAAKSGIYWSATNYCFFPMIPLMAAWLAGQETLCARLLPGLTARRHLVAGLLALSLLPPALGHMRTSLLQRRVEASGISYASTLEALRPWKELLNSGEVILIPSHRNARSAVVFDSPPWRFRTSVRERAEPVLALGLNPRFLLVLQHFEEHLWPMVPGYRLVQSHYSTPAEPVSFAGLTLSRITPGYGFALFERETPADVPATSRSP